MDKSIMLFAALVATTALQASDNAPTRNPDAEKAVDAALLSWSRSEWVADQYIAGTARQTDEKATPDGLIVGGTFKFSRFNGPPMELPFAALLKRSEGRLSVLDVCYNDAARRDISCRSTGTPFARELLEKAIRGELR